MNHIYKVVWSKVRGCYVVVAEIARSNGKPHSQKVVAVLGTALISSMLFTGGELLTAEAATGQTFGESTTASGVNSIAAGNATTASGQESIALGTHNTASGKWSVAFGGTSIQQTVRKYKKDCPVFQIGDKTYYLYEKNYFSTEDDAQFTGDSSKATAVMINTGNTASNSDSVAFGVGTQAKGAGSVAFGLNTQAGSETGGQNSIAFGNYTKALGGRSVAFGEYTIANYNDSVAFGNDTRALSTGATAFGNRTRALSSYSTAWGNATVAADEESTAWGSDTIAGAKLDDNGAVTNIYTYKNNPDDKNEQPKTATEKMDVHGNLAYIQNGSTVGVKQMDIGGNTEKHDYVVLDGQDGNTYVRDYQGSLWRVTVSADGKTATVDTTVGDNGKVYNNNSKAGTVGSKATTTVNGTEVAITPDSVLKKAHEGSNGYNIDGYKDATAFGYSTEASGDYATAFGNDTQTKASAATAFGTTTEALGDNATAFGLSTTASGKQATAFGSSSTASGDNATAFGESSTASGEASTAFGISSTASGRNSLAALGGTASAENAAAIGNGAQATLIDSVALGSNSKTTRAKYSALTDAKEKAAYAKGSTSTGSAWEATDNAIAVGNDSTTTRQITGVAAGSLDTDAVNVAQLRAVDAKHTIVTVGSNSVTADNTPVNGGNLDLKRTTATNGQETYDLSLDKNVTLGEQVENNGGKLTVNNVDKFKNYDKDGKPLPDTTVKEAVKIDGKTVSVVKHDGSAADNDQRQVVLGVDQDAGGYVALYDNTGRKPTYIYNAISGGITYLKDKNSYLTPDLTNPNDERASNEFNRLEYGDYHTGTIQFIATLDDGQKYAGDNYEAAKTETKTVDGKTTTTVTKEEQNVLLKKLNERLDIKGGATGALTDNNIGVNVKDDVMKVQLAQNLDLDDKGSVKMGDTTINNSGVTITTKDGNKTNTISLTENGLNNGGKTITNVGNGTNDSDAVNVSQLNAAKTTVKSSDNSISVTENPNGTPNHAYDIKVATATLSNGADGKVSVTNPNNNANSYATGNSVADAINKAGFTLTISNSGGGSVDGATNTLIHPGDTVTIDAGKNISLKQENGKISIATKDNLNLGSADSKDDKQQDVPGIDGSITVNGKNGSSVAINGQDGSIGLTGPKGADGKSTSIQMSTILSTPTLDDGKNIKTTSGEGGQQTTTQAPRIQYKNGNTTYEVATMDDGQKYAGDVQDSNAKANTFSRKLNEQTNVVGGVTNLDDLSKGNNVGVVSNGKDTLTIRLAKKLTDLTSVTTVTTDDKGNKTSETVQDGNGITITPSTLGNGKSAVSLTDNGLSNGGNQITHVDSGLKDAAGKQVELKDAIGDVLNNAVNVGDLKNVQNAVTSAHTAVTVNGSVEAPDAGANGTLGNYTDEKKGNLLLAQKKDSTGKITYDLKLNDKVMLGKAGKAGKDGIDGSIGLTGADGKSSIGLNGKDGISVIGKDGKNGVSITGSNGLNGKEGIDGKIAIGTPGKDGQPGKDAVSISGKDGVGHIGLTGQKGADGKDGAFTDLSTILGTATLDPAKNEQSNAKDTVSADDKSSRIQYQTTVTDKDGNTKTVITHEVATMDDGLKFAGDDVNTTVAKKLNSTLQIRGDGTYDKDKNTVADDGNIKTSVDNGAVKVALNDKINLHQDGSLTVGGDKKDGSTTVDDPIVIKHFDDKTLDMITGVGKDGKPIIAKEGKAGDYVTGLDNKDWNVDSPTYVSGRAATEDQLKKVSDAVNKTAGQHTVVTVNDNKDGHDTKAKAGKGTFGDYAGTDKDNLLIAAKDENGKTTYNIKLNDQLTIGQNSDPGVAGKDGKDGKVTVETKGGTTVVIGHDGKDGEPGRDGLFVTGKDGKDGKSGVSITGPNGAAGKDGVDGKVGIAGEDGKDAVSISGTGGVGHIGLTGPKGEKGADGTPGKDGISIDITTDLKTATLDDGKNVKTVIKDKDGKETTIIQAPRIQYDSNGKNYEVATMDDGLKIGANAAALGKTANPVSNKLNSTINIMGSAAKAGHTYTDDNLTTTVEQDPNGNTTVKVLMDKDITGNSVTVGEKGEKGESGTPGKDGVDGTIGVNGKDGSSVVIKGQDGISINGKDGQNGVTIKGVDGKAGTEGHIGLIGPKGPKGADGKDGQNASADIHVKNGQVGVDGTDGNKGTNGMDRVVYEDHNHVTHEVATMDDGMKYAGDFGKGASVKLNKTVNVTGNAKKEADLTDGNIGVVSSQSGDNGQLLIKLNKDLNLGNNGSVKMGNTTINNDGMTISKTESGKTTTVTLTDKGLDNGGNKITNVANGEISATSKDAVNGSQLNAVKTLASQHTTVEAGPSGNVTVTPGTNTDGSKKYTVDLAKDVTFGDAAKGDKTVAISGTDGKVTAGTGDEKVTVDGSKGQIVAGGDNGVKIGNIANGDSSLTIYDRDGKATGKTDKAGKFVTNLDNKTWNKDGSYVSGRVATEDQLHQVESNVNKQIADVNTKIDTVDKHHTEVTVNGGTAAKADGSYTDGNLQIAQKTGADGQKVYDLKFNDNLNIGGVGKDGKDGKDGHVGINGKDGKSGVGIDGKDGISVKGKDGQNGVTIKGVDGKDGTEGHIGLVGPKGPKGADGKDVQKASADIHVKNGQVGVDGTDGHGGKDGMDRVVYEDHNGTSHEVATMDDGMKYSGDSGNAAVKLNNKVQLYGGAKEYAAGDNIGVVVSQDGDNAKMQVKLARDLKGIDSIDAKTVTTGNTTINNSGMTVKGDDKHKDITVQQGTVNMGGNKIEGVAPGKVAPDSTDAVNGSQLAQRDQAIGKLGGEVSSLDRRVDRVGAGAAALAALHPQDFDPDDKWDFAVGYGNYRGANAAAVGAFYRPNEDTTLSVGGTVGGGENMVNAGISFKFGQGNHVTNSRVAMAKEILALKDYVQKQDEKIEKLEALVGQQGTAAAPKRRSILFPDVPENHWAYAYVKKLADRGLLEGYPDGEFKGDRTITRYEFAAIFSRALENGASVDNDMERMSEEFEPEIRELSLNRFRVDRVEGKDNDRHKIERVRVNDRDELVKQKNGEQKKRYRDLYGSVIEKDTPADAAK